MTENLYCQQARKSISLRLDGMLDGRAAMHLLEHLSRCEQCARFAHDVERTTRLLRRVGRAERRHVGSLERAHGCA